MRRYVHLGPILVLAFAAGAAACRTPETSVDSSYREPGRRTDPVTTVAIPTPAKTPCPNCRYCVAGPNAGHFRGTLDWRVDDDDYAEEDDFKIQWMVLQFKVASEPYGKPIYVPFGVGETYEGAEKEVLNIDTSYGTSNLALSTDIIWRSRTDKVYVGAADPATTSGVCP